MGIIELTLWLLLGVLTLLSLPNTAVAQNCKSGVILPVWEPQVDLTFGTIALRGTVYFLVMIYFFIGVSIISDRFMGAIEVITSKQKEIKIKRPTGSVQIIIVRVWNETVANLTLMALGSSAPEILLSIIEIISNDFEAGDIGPGTIVGSAAFNFLVIIGICIIAIPSGEMRKIKHLRVFFVTAAWSLFAYIWLLIILKLITPGVIDVWEGLVTFLFFPATVISAYVADRRLLSVDKFSKTYRLNKRGVIVEGEGNTELGIISERGFSVEDSSISDEIQEFEKNRQEYIDLVRELRKKHPNIETEGLETLARKEILNKSSKSRAFYRMQATRKLISGQNLLKRFHDRATNEAEFTTVGHEDENNLKETNITRIFFEPGEYTVMENVGKFDVSVTRRGGDLSETVFVDYKTEDGTACGDSDYIPVMGTLTFGPGETQQKINIEVIDDDIFEEDEHFFIRLNEARYQYGNSNGVSISPLSQQKIELAKPFIATINILDDDHRGIFNILDKDPEIIESIGTLDIKITRSSGARGKVVIPCTTIDGTAKPGKDYEHVHGHIVFGNNETEKIVKIPIIEENSYEKDTLFYFQILQPIPLDENDTPMYVSEKQEHMTKEAEIMLAGWPKLGSDNRAQIRIKESKEFKNTIDKLLQRANASLLVGTTSWKEQFLDAITINAGDDEDDNKSPSCVDYFMHILTVFWKILFAFIPPTDIWGGYLAFFVSILGIGVLTAFIGDIASHLGCTVGLPDTVTAIAFVALGTSVPDMFASKVAAVQDKYADASIGNVTGSNAVNVFLGIGIAWTIAAIVHARRTCTDGTDCNIFKVDGGSIGFSVSLFCACAVIAIVVMLVRRLPALGGGELGGPSKYKYSTAILFIALWLFYVTMSSLEAYKLIKGF